MPDHDIVVVGCSVGGVEALQKLVAGLPQDFAAAIFVVLHIAPESHSVLPDILNRAGTLSARHPQNREPIRHGCIYIAPPDRHLLIEGSRIVLSRGPRENRHRPSIDPLFRSAARAYGRQVIGIVLTGALDDGTLGLQTVKQAGGIAIVQDPAEAFCADMPRSAIEHVDVDHVAPVAEIPALLAELVPQRVARGNGTGKSNRQLEKEIRLAEAEMDAIEDENRSGIPSQFACPDCGGVLWEVKDEAMLRFRCRVGHAFTAQTLSAQQAEALEGALWAAIRALEERASLARQMSEKVSHGKAHNIARRFEEIAQDKMQQASVLRNLLVETTAVAVE